MTLEPLVTRWRDAPLFRFLTTALLALLLQIPIGLIASTISERAATRDGAREEIAQTFGGPQQLVGPVLVLPLVHRWVDDEGKRHERTWNRVILPRTLSIRGRLDTEVRRRGIFDLPVFVAKVRVEGTFAPGANDLGPVQPQAVLWQRAQLAFGLSDPRAIRSSTPLAAGARSVAFEPGPEPAGGLRNGLHAPVPLEPGAQMPFSFELTLGGSTRLAVVPVGSETTVALSSSWPSPGFDGHWLPVERHVGPGGFDATWRVLHLARNFPSSWNGSEVDLERLGASAFGVRLVSPVDAWRSNERAVKYELLFLGLTFLGFTLFELLSGLRVHPVQYLLVGLALGVFYLLLLSLSEQLGFGRAYLVASGAVVGLVTAYARIVLRAVSRALIFGALLAALYAFLFVLLQLEDFALLVGSVGLFAVLSAVMWFTRKLDWYQLRPSPLAA